MSLLSLCSSPVVFLEGPAGLKVKVNVNPSYGLHSYTLLLLLHPSRVRPVRAHLAGDHEQGEEQDEGALGDGDPVGLLQGEQDGSVQAGLGGAVETAGGWLVCLFILKHFELIFTFYMTSRC